MAVLADFRTRFPVFDAQTDDRVQMFLDDAALIMKEPDRWLDFYDVAHLYLTAHLLALAIATDQGDFTPLAPIKKQEVDDVVLEHAVGNVNPTQTSLYSTSFGKEYYKYLRLCFAGIYGV